MTYEPDDFGPGESGEQIIWLRERLAAHGYPSPTYWTEEDRLAVQQFQLAQGWRGTQLGGGADGYPGPKTIARLTADPIVEEPDPDPEPVPSGIDWSIWKWTSPDGEEGDPDEFYPIDEDFEYPPWLVKNADGSCTFRANCGGVTTEHSDYPRSELREMNPDGSRADWSNASGTHIMRARMAITHVPEEKRHVVGAQIHDDEDDVIMVRREGNHLFVESPYSEDLTFTRDYTGFAFDLEIVASPDGIEVTYDDGVNTVTVTVDVIRSGCYFKAGCYTQSNTETGDEADAYGEVVIYDLEVEHVR